ncbi:MAG: hypothetical protein K9L98_02910 [Candidatus Pacebacteria bacterium]|nr:hypothetical protein [Candidatus Paceibacterota bacterium]MCF7862934.1 hypothetical protein [Candidatus Paceibacterota bacterium]
MKNKKEEKNEEMYTESDMKRYIGMLSEMHEENLKAIREGFLLVNIKLDEHTRILDEHTRILDEHTRILGGHDKRLDTHEGMLGSILENIEEIKISLDTKADKKDLLKLEKRIVVLESKL